jgi:hypothetical protein
MPVHFLDCDIRKREFPGQQRFRAPIRSWVERGERHGLNDGAYRALVADTSK